MKPHWDDPLTCRNRNMRSDSKTTERVAGRPRPEPMLCCRSLPRAWEGKLRLCPALRCEGRAATPRRHLFLHAANASVVVAASTHSTNFLLRCSVHIVVASSSSSAARFSSCFFNSSGGKPRPASAAETLAMCLRTSSHSSRDGLPESSVEHARSASSPIARRVLVTRARYHAMQFLVDASAPDPLFDDVLPFTFETKPEVGISGKGGVPRDTLMIQHISPGLTGSCPANGGVIQGRNEASLYGLESGRRP
jgi:hypothetical protein